MTFDFIYSKDLYEIREKVLKLDKEIRDTNKGDEVIIVEKQKSEHLIKRLEEADKQIFSLTTKLQNLMDNYAAFSSVLGVESVASLENKKSKKELGNQVFELKKKNTDITEKYMEEIEKLKKELQETKETWAIKLDDTQQEHRKKDELLEDSWKEKLLKEESQSRLLKEELDEIKKTHANSLDILKKQHHDELENLRIQFEVLQRSFPSSSGMNVYAQKFQQIKLELEKQLVEKDTKVKELTMKLKEAEGEIKHLKLLSVVRSAQKAPPISVTSKDKENQPDPNNFLKNSKEMSKSIVGNGEYKCVTTSNVSTTRKESSAQGTKGTKKRKLYSKVTFSSPEEILY